jgi:hypothetical protein
MFLIPRYMLTCLLGLSGYLIYDYFYPILGLRLVEVGLEPS